MDVFKTTNTIKLCDVIASFVVFLETKTRHNLMRLFLFLPGSLNHRSWPDNQA